MYSVQHNYLLVEAINPWHRCLWNGFVFLIKGFFVAVIATLFLSSMVTIFIYILGLSLRLKKYLFVYSFQWKREYVIYSIATCFHLIIYPRVHSIESESFLIPCNCCVVLQWIGACALVNQFPFGGHSDYFCYIS